MKNNRLIIAIQKDGRLTNGSLGLFRKAGFNFVDKKSCQIIECKNFPLTIIKIRHSDIPWYVENGIATMGIVGKNILHEINSKVSIVSELNFGICSLQVAVPTNSHLKNINDLKNLTIATSHIYLTKRYFKKNNIPLEITKLSGSVEMAPSLGIADAVVDLVETGKTLSTYKLKPICTIYKSNAVLITQNKKMSFFGQNLIKKVKKAK